MGLEQEQWIQPEQEPEHWIAAASVLMWLLS